MIAMANNSSRIAVLLPCFNEASTIAEVVRSYREHLPDADIYVYDNNSTDETASIAASAGAIVKREYRQGKGFVVRSMFRDIDADVYLLCDGDGTYDANDVVTFAKDIEDERADMVIGDRLSGTYFKENKRAFHGSGNKLVRWLINAIFSADIHDVMTGARAFSRRFVKSYPSLIEGFEIETEMTIHALDKDFLITQHPVTYRDRQEGSHSKIHTFADGLRILKTIFALFKDFRPLLFFGLVSAVLFIIAAILFAIPLNEYLTTGLVTRFPTLIVAVALGIMALLSGASGIIVDSIRKQTRTFFELELNRIK